MKIEKMFYELRCNSDSATINDVIYEADVYIAALIDDNTKLKNELKRIKKGGKGKCCEYCTKHEQPECPVKSAEPWSRWRNFCSEFEGNEKAVNVAKPVSVQPRLAEVLTELLHEAMSLLMNYEQRCEMDWIEDYEELIAKYNEHFS